MDEPTRAPRDQGPAELDERPSARAERRSRLAEAFERQRPYLRRVAYRMLGSMAEAEDALQECWIRLDRRPPEDMADLRPWLTTVIGRICLDALRARRSHREDNVGSWLPEPVVAMYDSPEDEAARADSVGLALLVVLETLSPPERLAFVLHDVFAVPFDEIAPIVDRSTEATRQLASRGRRRVRAARADRDEDVVVRRNVADAFLAAARGGEFEQLLALLDPDVALHIDVGDREALAQPPIRGARQVAEYLRSGAGIFAPLCRPAIVNGGPGFVVGRPGQVIGVVGLTLAAGRIREVDIVADAAKLEAIRRAGW